MTRAEWICNQPLTTTQRYEITMRAAALYLPWARNPDRIGDPADIWNACIAIAAEEIVFAEKERAA